MSNDINANKLIHTKQGQDWLNQFELIDQEFAILLANNLTLLSHIEFERNLLAKIESVASSIEGSVGFFAVRELKKEKPDECGIEKPLRFYSQAVVSEDGKSVSALSSSADQGSEARVANIIRQVCKSNLKKHLNHPTIEPLRESKSDAIIFVDDFIGSGERAKKFLDSFWVEPTIVSWLSGKQIFFHVVAYSGTESGVSYLENHKSKPQVHIFRDTPSFDTFAWDKERKNQIKKLCQKYGHIAYKNRKNMWLGYKEGMVAIVFEHGCPNNTPAILWGSDCKGSGWKGLFPNRTVSSSVASVFPAEIVRGDHVKILVDAGQKKLASSGALSRLGLDEKTILTILALIAKGQRRRSTLSFSTGLNVEECERAIQSCIEWKFITVQKRITEKGLTELNAARKLKIKQSRILDKGPDYYYPKQLREATHN
jgi:hypothetical protein